MSPTDNPQGKSRVVAGRYPPPGTNSYADAIRERRGARGLTPLDANLLHCPPIAGGYNGLMGAIRTQGLLPGDVREAMILRIAAVNHAAFEWIHHEQVGRQAGLSTGQLYIIRDAQTPLPPSPTLLTALLTAAVDFTDRSTCGVRVPMPVIQELKKQLREWVVGSDSSLAGDAVDAKVDDLYVEAAMVVASYNMVSRFLIATDVAGLSDMEVPWPVDKKEHLISLPVFPHSPDITHTIHAVTLITSPTAPWIVFMNSLLTDWTMWNHVVPYLLDPLSSSTTTYNILLHSQRGHGLSTLPPTENTSHRVTTIPLLADDVASLLDALAITTPVHSVIGVSQGGAAALAFAAAYATKTRSVVACDTAPRTPAGNKEAWEERIRLVHGTAPTSGTEQSANDASAYAKAVGMAKLAAVTVPRWFPLKRVSLSDATSGGRHLPWIQEMITRTDVAGFVHGARALSDYDVMTSPSSPGTLFDNFGGRVLLVAGRLDGGGKVADGLKDMCEKWNDHRERSATIEGGKTSARVEFLEINDAGHLPMVDFPDQFCNLLGKWLQTV